MAKRMIIMLIAVGVVLGGIYGFQVFKAGIIKKVMASLSNPPQTVSTVVARYDSWTTEIGGVGSVRAQRGADLSLQLAGIVEKIGFHSGQDVQQGQVLLNLNNDDDIAKLHALQATAELAGVTYRRDVAQMRAQGVSQATVDADSATLKNDLAQVAAQQAIVDQKVLRAPFAGHLGIRQVDLGQYLAAGTTIVTLQALDTVYVDFYLPQQDLAHIAAGQKIVAHVDTWPGIAFTGHLQAINPLIDTATRNVQVRAVIANPDHKLLPGMFATLDIATGAPREEITLPQTAIAYNPYGDTVFIVRSKDVGGKKQLYVEQNFVTLGATRGDQVAVLKGVKPGEQIVSAGQIKLHNGSPVAINNSVQPLNDANPKPADE
ncbi:MAG: efflux RND transporter periplasmic adaptor subunit [Rhodospirillales bacterium]|nr:efflux RND transporter periplasmic adaptor subunit [Rhodospirillales bacterium]